MISVSSETRREAETERGPLGRPTVHLLRPETDEIFLVVRHRSL